MVLPTSVEIPVINSFILFLFHKDSRSQKKIHKDLKLLFATLCESLCFVW
jgi:hypothetical protein